MTGYIYTLRPKDSNEIFYVGYTKNLKQRLLNHQAYYKLKLVIEVLEEVEYNNVNEIRSCEEFWIEQVRQWGFILKNLASLISVKKDRCATHIHLKYVPEDIDAWMLNNKQFN